MNQPRPQRRINYLISVLRNHLGLLIIPAVIGFILATAYAFCLMPEMWTARQSFLIRDDLSGTAFKPGHFDSEESRKSAQETILEVARRPLVVRNVLEKLGPKSLMAGKNWIDDETIEKTQKAIDISAPNGAEFGKTDAIVLTAKASSRERTRKFIELLSAEIMTQTNRIRSLRFESMESELSQSYLGAAQARDEAIDRLDKLAQRLGSDFGFLSLTNDSRYNNQSTGVEGIKSEILRKQDELEQAEGVFASLSEALNNPEAAAQLPSELLIALPTLESAMSKMLDLREQLHVAKGQYSDRHARVRALVKALEFSQQQIYDSLTGEMAGVRASIALKKQQLGRLEDRIEEEKSRLVRLSKSRAEHRALTAQVEQLGEVANRAKTAWKATKSRAETARSVGLITPTDVAQVNSRPDGVGKKIIALAGLLGGLMVGLGLVLLNAPPMDPGPVNSLSDDPSPQAALDPRTGFSSAPQHPVSIPVGSSATSGAFQHAASAMQSAADSMRLAASSQTTVQPKAESQSPNPSVPVDKTPKQPEPSTSVAKTKNPTQPAANPTRRPATDPTQTPIVKTTAAADAMRIATENQASSTPPKDPRSQPAVKQSQAAKPPTQPQTKVTSAETTGKPAATAPTKPVATPEPPTQPVTPSQPIQAAPEVATTGQAEQALTAESVQRAFMGPDYSGPASSKSKTPPDNVRPVDLAKSASEKNEFFRVNMASGGMPAASPNSSQPEAARQTPEQPRSPRAKIDSTVSKSAQAMADTVSSSHPSNQPPERTSPATTILSDDQTPNTRTPAGTEPFVISADGETSQTSADDSQDLNDAIPEQIRKLSQSIKNFGRGKGKS